MLLALLISFVINNNSSFACFMFTVLFMVPAVPLDLTGTILSFHHSIPEAVNGGMAHGGCSCWQLFLGTVSN